VKGCVRPARAACIELTRACDAAGRAAAGFAPMKSSTPRGPGAPAGRPGSAIRAASGPGPTSGPRPTAGPGPAFPGRPASSERPGCGCCIGRPFAGADRGAGDGPARPPPPRGPPPPPGRAQASAIGANRLTTATLTVMKWWQTLRTRRVMAAPGQTMVGPTEPERRTCTVISYPCMTGPPASLPRRWP